MPGLRGPSALLRLQSDERLIILTRRGQPAAFETLCARYQSRLLAFCRHMLASREDAEDVLQDVFAAAYNAVLADERTINVRPWLYRIARNRSLNHLRRSSAIGVDTMDVHFAENGLSTGDKVMRRESFRELIGDVQRLPESQRTALLLREIDALSYEQIAEAMETTVPSIKSLLVRARISLAEAAEARKLSCEEVRLELGEAAEGLVKLSNPARRHVRDCERCTFFKRQLKENNRALAAILPVGPLLLIKNLLLAKLGSTASGAHVAGGAGATVAGGSIASGAAAGGGGGFAGGLMTAGAGAVATKAVAGLAAAAIVTAGAVAADHAVVAHPHHHAGAASAHPAAPVARYASTPVVVREQPQPTSASGKLAHHAIAAAVAKRPAHRPTTRTATPIAAAAALPAASNAASAAPEAPAAAAPAPAGPTAEATKPAANPTPPVQVTTETTELPAAATTEQAPAGEPTGATPTAPPVAQPTAEPVPVPEPAAAPAEATPKRAPRHHAAAEVGGTEAPPHLSDAARASRRASRG